MARNRSRGMRKQQLTTKKAVTRDYQPIMIHHWGVRPRDLPIFTFLSIQAMLYDPTIRLGLAMRAAPVYQTQFGWKEQGQWQEGVQCKNEAVKQFLDRQLQRIWQQDVNLLVKSQLWGHTGGEVMLRLSEDNLVEVDCLLDRHPNDVRALKRGGQNVGVRIARLTNQGAVDMEWPKAYWTTYNPEAGCFYGTSVLIGAYSPWYDKWCDGGALDVRRLYMHKDAYVGCSIYYPEGDLYTMPDGSEVPARDLARQMIEQIVAGGVVALPSDQDEKGNRKWELKPATVASNPAHILKYPQDLDTEMLRGIEVPDDIFTADSTSSGAWAGKKVPLSAFYAGLDSWVVQMTKDLKRCIFESLVLLNFGKAIDFEIGHKPLAEQAMEQQNQPQGGGGGQPPGQPGAEGMPGMPGQPGGDEGGGGGGGGSLADLLSSPAAQQARQSGGQPQQMSLDAAIGRGVVEAAAIVKASRETLDAALVRMDWDALPPSRWSDRDVRRMGDTPREGDRNAEGLIFHGSRWHREDELPRASKPSGTGAAKTPEASKPTVSNESHVAAYQGGDKSAAERLLKQNAGLIYSMAKKFAKHFDELDDLQQEARIAVLHAAKAFDPSRGLQFSTLATRAIINRLSNVSTRAGKRKSVWMQTPEDEEGHQTEPSVQPDRLPMEASEQQATVLKAVEALPERTRVIVQRRYGLDGGEPESATAIAERVGLSPQRVAKILDGAKDKLRSALQDYSIQLAIRMAGEVNPWTPYKGKHGGQGWVRSDTKEVRYQKERPGAHEGAPGQQPGTPGKPAAETPPTPAPKTPQELESALQAVAADPAAHGLHEEEAAKLQQAKTTAEKIAVLDEATGHKFDKGGAAAAAAQQPAAPQKPAAQPAATQNPVAAQPPAQPAAATPQQPAKPQAASSYSRIELPQIRGDDKPEFYKQLQAEGIGVEMKSVPAGQLKGIQRDLNPEKVKQMVATIQAKGTLGKSPLLASNDGYIVDGHHRWAAEKSVDPNRPVEVAQVDLPVRDLIAKIEKHPKAFKAGTDEPAGERPPVDRNGIGYGMRDGWPWNKPAPSHEEIAKAYPATNPKGNDSQLQHRGGPLDHEGRPTGAYTPQRQALHKSLVERHFKGKQPVPQGEQPTYLFLGGGTAAGKSTVLRSGAVKVPQGAVTVDSDEIKNELPEFQRASEDRVMGAAGIVHEESSDVSKMVNSRAIEGRYHAVMDGTGDTSLESVAKKVSKARAAGHKIVATYMTNDIEKAVENAQKRASKPPYRMVSMKATLSIHAGVSKVFPQAVAAGLFDEVTLWDTNGDKPVLVASGKGKDLMIHDQGAYDKFLAKQNLLETHKHLIPAKEAAQGSPL